MTRISHVGTISNMNIHINPPPRVYKRDTAYVISKKKKRIHVGHFIFSQSTVSYLLLKPAIPTCPSCKKKKKSVVNTFANNKKKKKAE